VVCLLKAGKILSEKSSLLGYGTINNDATMKNFTSCNLTYDSTAGIGVLCGSALIVTSYNNRGIDGSGVLGGTVVP
jgi:hypothetical protein